MSSGLEAWEAGAFGGEIVTGGWRERAVLQQWSRAGGVGGADVVRCSRGVGRVVRKDI